MGRVLLQLGVLTLGLALTEIGITGFVAGSWIGLLVLGTGLLGLIGGTAAFMLPLVGHRPGKEGD